MNKKVAVKVVLSVLATSFLIVVLFAAVSADNRHLALSRYQVQSVSIPIVNPGFEGVYTSMPGENEVKLPPGWEHWYRADTRRPEYLEGGVTHTGKAVKQFTTHDIVDAGVRQKVYDVTPGQWYEFSIWAYYRSTPAGNKMSAVACINPWGDTKIEYRTTVCGEEIVGAEGEWVRVNVKAQAWGDEIVIAGRFVAEWPFAYSDVFWDDAFLETITIGGARPTPEPCPTCAPGSGPDCAGIEAIGTVVKGIVDGREPVIWTPGP